MIPTNAEMSERFFFYGPSDRQRPDRPKPNLPFPVPEHQPEDQGKGKKKYFAVAGCFLAFQPT
jgi:hypothetical protein